MLFLSITFMATFSLVGKKVIDKKSMRPKDVLINHFYGHLFAGGDVHGKMNFTECSLPDIFTFMKP